MKIQKKVTKLPLIIIASVLMVILGGAGIYLTGAFKQNDTAKNSDSTEQTKQAGNQAKTETVNDTNEVDDKQIDDSDKGQQQPSKAPESIIITASSQNGNVYQIRTLISALVDGKCTIVLTKGAETVTKSADIASFAQSSTCKGFDIPVSELSKGKWSVNITFENAEVSGKTSAEIEVI